MTSGDEHYSGDEYDPGIERAKPRWRVKAASAITLTVLAFAGLQMSFGGPDTNDDQRALGGVFFFAALLSAAILMLLIVVPRIGRELPDETPIEDALDAESLDLLDRATRAVDAIAASRAQERGLLDEIANSLVLEEQTSEIADKLLVVSDLRRGEEAVEATTPAALARLRRQREATDAAAASLARRVEALESYAGQVAELDALLHETTVMARLDERDALVADLLAETARDQPAVEDVDRLASGLPAVADALERQLRAVRERGLRFLDTDL